jgi:hypothetical protein
MAQAAGLAPFVLPHGLPPRPLFLRRLTYEAVASRASGHDPAGVFKRFLINSSTICSIWGVMKPQPIEYSINGLNGTIKTGLRDEKRI